MASGNAVGCFADPSQRLLRSGVPLSRCGACGQERLPTNLDSALMSVVFAFLPHAVELQAG